MADLEKLSKLVFLCGSSCVGKTSLMNAFPEFIIDHEGIDWEVIKVQMNVTDIRAKIGNPSWETLMHDPATAHWQQDHILEVYRQRISEIVDRKDTNKIYLFERCELDVNGYSSAFKVNKMHIQEMQFSYANYYVIHRPIDPSLVYQETANRPPESVRDDCAIYLSGVTHTYLGGAVLPYDYPRFMYKVHHSLNNGTIEDQISRIATFILD